MGVKFGFKLNNSLVVGPDSGGGDIPSELKTEMNEVFNRKFGTSQIYDPDIWAETVNIMGPLPVKTVSGSICTFNDGADGIPVKDLVAQIVPIQSGSGDPSPSNVRPISGYTGVNVTRAGVNIFNPSAITADTWFSDVDGSTEPQNGYGVTDFIKINGGASYYKGDNGSGRILFYDKDKNSITSAWNVMSSSATAFTAPSSACYIRFTVLNSKLSGFFVNSDSTDTNYHVYNATTYSVTWQTEAGTVYGGFIGLTTGLLTGTYVIVDLGSLTWVKVTSGQTPYFSTNAELSQAYKWVSQNANALCNNYSYASIGSTGSDDGFFITNTSYIRIRDENYAAMTADEFKTAIAGTKIVYELVTPQTYQLTPKEVKTLLGVNNIFADTGDTELTYYVDINTIMSQLEAQNTPTP